MNHRCMDEVGFEFRVLGKDGNGIIATAHVDQNVCVVPHRHGPIFRLNLRESGARLFYRKSHINVLHWL